MQTEQNQGQTTKRTTTTPERQRVEHKVCKCKLTCQQWIRVVAWCLPLQQLHGWAPNLPSVDDGKHFPRRDIAQPLNDEGVLELWSSMLALPAGVEASAGASCIVSSPPWPRTATVGSEPACARQQLRSVSCCVICGCLALVDLFARQDDMVSGSALLREADALRVISNAHDNKKIIK